MSQTDAPDRAAIRRAVADVLSDEPVSDEPVSKREVLCEVAARRDTHESVVREELAELAEHGFVYVVGDGDTAEVRLP